MDGLNRRAEIGYWLGREFQGRGIVTDALRLGFTLEGVLRQAGLLHDRYVDLEVYSMLRGQFG